MGSGHERNVQPYGTVLCGLGTREAYDSMEHRPGPSLHSHGYGLAVSRVDVGTVYVQGENVIFKFKVEWETEGATRLTNHISAPPPPRTKQHSFPRFPAAPTTYGRLRYLSQRFCTPYIPTPMGPTPTAVHQANSPVAVPIATPIPAPIAIERGRFMVASLSQRRAARQEGIYLPRSNAGYILCAVLTSQTRAGWSNTAPLR